MLCTNKRFASHLLRRTNGVAHLNAKVATFDPTVTQHSLALRARLVHTVPSPKIHQPLPYTNWAQLLQHYIKAEDFTRTVEVSNGRRMAIEEDYRQLFTESDVQPEQILMHYDELGRRGVGRTVVAVLHDEEQARKAVQELNGAVLFDTKLRIRPFQKGKAHHVKANYVEALWGLYAVSESSMRQYKLRAPLLIKPDNVRANL